MNKACLCTRNITKQSSSVSLELDFPAALQKCIVGKGQAVLELLVSSLLTPVVLETSFVRFKCQSLHISAFPIFDHRNFRRQLSCFSEKRSVLLIWHFKEKDIFLHSLVYFGMQHLYSNSEGLESSDVNIFPSLTQLSFYYQSQSFLFLYLSNKNKSTTCLPPHLKKMRFE